MLPNRRRSSGGTSAGLVLAPLYPSQCSSSRDDRAKPLENCVPFWEIGHECATKCFPGQILLCCTSIQGRAIKHSHDNADAPLPTITDYNGQRTMVYAEPGSTDPRMR